MVDTMYMDTVTTRPDTSVSMMLDTLAAYYNYEITYSWTAIDTAGNPATVSQVIVVQDTMRPDISYGDTLLITAVGNDCMGNVTLDLGEAITDNCSDSLDAVSYTHLTLPTTPYV